MKTLLNETENLKGLLEKVENKKRLNKKEIGQLTKALGGAFYGMCALMNEYEISDESVEKAAVTEQKRIEGKK